MESPTLIMRFCGGQISLPVDAPDEALWAFYSTVFERTSREVLPGVQGVTRHLAFRAAGEDGNVLHFLGIEVPHLSDLPEGMWGWELTSDTRSVWGCLNGIRSIVSQEPIRWNWIHMPLQGDARPIGEFSVAGPDGSGRNFEVSAHAYVRAGGAAVDDTIRLVEYDPAWPDQYRQFEAWLRDRLSPEVALCIEHYGSTAIPGMPAKPIIDVLVEVPSFTVARERALPALNSPEWECWWCIDHLIFIRRDPHTGQRTHHLHMAPQNHREWQSLVFRDHLRSHPQDAREYLSLKQTLAERFASDRERYTQEKTEFIQEILSRAQPR